MKQPNYPLNPPPRGPWQSRSFALISLLNKTLRSPVLAPFVSLFTYVSRSASQGPTHTHTHTEANTYSNTHTHTHRQTPHAPPVCTMQREFKRRKGEFVKIAMGPSATLPCYSLPASPPPPLRTALFFGAFACHEALWEYLEGWGLGREREREMVLFNAYGKTSHARILCRFFWHFRSDLTRSLLYLKIELRSDLERFGTFGSECELRKVGSQ